MNLQTPRPEHGWWLTAFLASRQVRLCLVILAIVALTPPQTGWGFEVCAWKRLTNAPCPGCGLTRSGANLLRGNVHQAFSYHPFGLFLHPLLLGLAAFSVLPDTLRRHFTLRLLPWRRAVNAVQLLFWLAFFAFGLARWTMVMTDVLTFPPSG